MQIASSLPSQPPHQRSGLVRAMRRVLKESARAARDLRPDAVHDLRVALRRCRSMAASLRALDPDPRWSRLNRASRKLFRALGSLRDVQVAGQWVRKLSLESDPTRLRLLDLLAARELVSRQQAEIALKKFDGRQWRGWISELPERAARIPLDGLAFQHLALEAWLQLAELHKRATRRRSRLAWHQLRISLKRFRYTAENFLPRRYAEWKDELKLLQDLLGELHDLDDLRRLLRALRPALAAAVRDEWLARLDTEIASRILRYRALTGGSPALFERFRASLPAGRRLEAAALAKLTTWAHFLDPDPVHSRCVARLAMELFDGFASAHLDSVFRDAAARRVLHGAALLHDVGRSRRDAGHHKASGELIRRLKPPIGWTADDIRLMALVARYHRGAEPRPAHPGFSSLGLDEQQKLAWLAALLRLAEALDAGHHGRVLNVEVESVREAIVLRADGYVNDLFSAARLAERKHLLEAITARPVILRGASPVRLPVLRLGA